MDVFSFQLRGPFFAVMKGSRLLSDVGGNWDSLCQTRIGGPRLTSQHVTTLARSFVSAAAQPCFPFRRSRRSETLRFVVNLFAFSVSTFALFLQFRARFRSFSTRKTLGASCSVGRTYFLRGRIHFECRQVRLLVTSNSRGIAASQLHTR